MKNCVLKETLKTHKCPDEIFSGISDRVIMVI
jgi:hypothetical protein